MPLAVANDNITHLGSFPWGHVKTFVYHTRPCTAEYLKENNRAATDITPQTLERVRCSVQHRINLCEQQEGHQFEHLLRW
jgi:hypothetical protein